MGMKTKEKIRRAFFQEFYLVTEAVMMCRLQSFPETLKKADAWKRLGHQSTSYAKLQKVPHDIISGELENLEHYLSTLERAAKVKRETVKAWADYDNSLRTKEEQQAIALQLNIQNNTSTNAALPFTRPIDTLESEIDAVNNDSVTVTSSAPIDSSKQKK